MPETREQLVAFLEAGTASGARGRLAARGLARGMIWRGGRLPEGAPPFGVTLTTELLDHGYGLLDKALQLREAEHASHLVRNSLVVAAESIESAVRNGEADEARDFHLVVAAVAFHLARLSARSFCLVPDPAAGANLSTTERLLVGIMRRDLRFVRETCARWLRDANHQDNTIAARLADLNAEFGLEDAEVVALTRNFVRATAALVSALDSGSADAIEVARRRYALGADAALARRYVPQWWMNLLARHLADDLWVNSLHVALPRTVQGDDADRWERLRQQFIAVLYNRPQAQVELWPSQLAAARRATDPADDLVVALPTSAGKTRIAELCILRTLAQGRRVVYVTPLRALSAQLERTLAQTFAPLGASVSALYGASGIAQTDIATIRDGTIVVATPEKLDFALRVEPSVLDDVGLVVLDEGHMIGFGVREFRYEVLVQRLLRRPDAGARRIVCLSAVFTVGEAFNDFTAWIRSDADGDAIHSDWRPTRQRIGVLTWRETRGWLELAVDGETPFVPQFVPQEDPRGRRRRTFPADEEELVVATAKAFVASKHRVLIYCPQRRSVEKLAQTCLTLHRQGYLPSTLAPGESIDKAITLGEEWLGADHVALRALRIGIAVHHGLLPRAFLAEVENLLDRRVLRMVIASPTIAQGLDLSCSVLVLRSIFRYRDQTISPVEFANVRGRAGRAYVDLDGITVYPIYETGLTRQFRLQAFQRLVRDAETRSLESGLLQLVETLATLLARRLGVQRAALMEYVTNQGVDWNALEAADEGAIDAGEGGEEDGRSDGSWETAALRMLLSAVDTVILNTVADPAIGVEALGAALDEALQSSLWARRLARRDPADRVLANALMRGRARWIWEATVPEQRRGYYAAGVGVSAGRHLDQHATRLVALLRECEEAIAQGTIAAGLAPLYEAVELLTGMDPFRFEHRPDNWREVLETWVSGGGLANVLDRSRGVGFIQDDIVYRLVWAVEAVRVHALARNVPQAADLAGLLPLVLTYGLPSRPGILLARAGLNSRRMVMELVARFPDIFQGEGDVRAWIRGLAERIDAGFWEDGVSAELWREFAARWLDVRGGAWAAADAEAQVVWTPGRPVPEMGSRVRLVHDPRDGVTYVCTEELETLGQLTLPLPVAARGSISATVAGAERLSLRLFTPRSPA